MVPVTKIPRTIPFQEEIPLNDEQISAYRQLHGIISLIEVGKNVSYARSTELAKNRKQILKLLWAFGLFGELDQKGENIKLDSKAYSAEKLTAYYARLKENLFILKKHSLNCEIVPIQDKIWKTKNNALRNKGWYLKMTSNKSEGLLKALKDYTKLLNEKYEKNAFRYFAKADMRVLCDYR